MTKISNNWLDKVPAKTLKGNINTSEGIVQDLTVSQASSILDHNVLANYSSNEHIDWTQNQTKTIHSDNYTRHKVSKAGIEILSDVKDMDFSASGSSSLSITDSGSGKVSITISSDNYYLNGISKSGNTLTLSVAGTSNQSYTFGSNAFTSFTDHSIQGYLTDITGESLSSINDVSDAVPTDDYVLTWNATSGVWEPRDVDSVASSYSHPTYTGDNASIDTGALSGATVISDLDFNINSDTEGHVTDANATVSTRNLTKSDIGLGNVPNTNIAYASAIAADAFTSTEVANLRAAKLDDGTTPWTSNNYYDDTNVESYLSGGAGINFSSGVISIDGTVATETWVTNNFNNYSHPTHPGDDFSVDTTVLSGAAVVSSIDINVTTDTEGHVTDANGAISTRTLTLGDLGYTGDTNANNYSLENHSISHHSDMDQTVQTTDDVAFNSTTYGNFKIEYNSTSNSLDFNFIG